MSQSGLLAIKSTRKVVSREPVSMTNRLAKCEDPLVQTLDARVQTVLTRMWGEVAERYGKHACFAGVQINLSERSHFNFAGDCLGLR